MKKTAITFLSSWLLVITSIKAQSIQEGMNHLYAGRYESATRVFEKLVAINPNNIDAIYWLGQSYLEDEEIRSARIAATRQLYEKAMQTSNGAPLIMVGLGHIELLENKTSEARQHFETALTMTRTKKGDDPSILFAIARANVDAKSGDAAYAVQKMEAAVDKGEKTPEMLLELGNAYRKQRPGEGGGQAYQTYQKALQVNPNFAPASLRLAKLFESQKNYELVLQYLNESVAKDPKFTLGYYELFYYYFYRGKYPEAEAQLIKYIDSKLPATDIQDQYLYSQLCLVKKDFDCAISKSETVVSSLGALTKPKVYRLLGEAYLQKGLAEAAKGDSVNAMKDYLGAKRYSDMFFAKKNDPILPDYERAAQILGALKGNPDEVYKTYMDGIALDTTLDAKLGYLKKGAAYFKENNLRDKEALVLAKIIEMKPKPTLNDYFDLTLANYFSGDYAKSRDAALQMRSKFQDEVYGYDWAFKNSSAVDTLKQDSIAVPDASSLYQFSQRDSLKFKKQYIASVRFLAAYYINKAKDKDKSLDYFRKWQWADTANAAMIQGYIDAIEKSPVKQPAKQPAGKNPKGTTGKTTTPATKPSTTKTKATTVNKKTVARH